MRQPLLPLSYDSDLEFESADQLAEGPKGVVYTKPWAVELLLDLAGYAEQADLTDAIAVEPSAGEGAFLVPMALRLLASCRRQGRSIADGEPSLIAYELNPASANVARDAVERALRTAGVDPALARRLAGTWVRSGDYLLDADRLPLADFVIGNPPYIRLEDIAPKTAGLYRGAYSTMRGRADLYIAFFEAALRQLKPGGVCGYLCADRWMLNQYGAQLRRLVTGGFSVEAIVEMHDAAPFDQPRDQRPENLAMAVVDGWFRGDDPWPCGSPARLPLLRRLEDQFEPLESDATGTRIGIGVATGLDQVFITKDPDLVETSRLLPLAMAEDTATGQFQWSGHYLVNPWEADGLANLRSYPRLRAYLENHQDQVKKRHVARRDPDGWHRTIDRVHLPLTAQPKLYVPDIKNCFNPVLDRGTAYPHHNLYFLVSKQWDLEVLGGLLLSSIGQLFIEAYGVRMRGGYLRFQAQYLRRVRVPAPDTLSRSQQDRLIEAFRRRDRRLASAVAFEAYHVSEAELENASQHSFSISLPTARPPLAIRRLDRYPSGV